MLQKPSIYHAVEKRRYYLRGNLGRTLREKEHIMSEERRAEFVTHVFLKKQSRNPSYLLALKRIAPHLDDYRRLLSFQHVTTLSYTAHNSLTLASYALAEDEGGAFIEPVLRIVIPKGDKAHHIFSSLLQKNIGVRRR